MSVPLSQQLKEVRREIVMRERNYPRWVTTGKMTQSSADRQLEAMRAVEQTVARLAKAEELAL